MDKIEELNNIVRKFLDNINKEPKERRERLDRNEKLLCDLNKLDNQFARIIKNSDSTDPDFLELFEKHSEQIRASLKNARDILNQRIVIINSSKNSVKMGEKFDLRTAASLLPSIDSTEESVKQLIDSIELYNDMLEESEKMKLINYILKIKLTQNAKLRLRRDYRKVDELVLDMKNFLLTKKSPAALSTQLHNVRQEGKSIEDFAKLVEQLSLDLTISQADNDSAALDVLRQVNEKIAINTFANGLRNSEIRTIIKARNYSNLKDAVASAKEEELVKNSYQTSNPKLFHFRQRNSTHNENKYRSGRRYSENNNRRQKFNPNHTTKEGRGRRSNYNNNRNNRNSKSHQVYMTKSDDEEMQNADKKFFRS